MSALKELVERVRTEGEAACHALPERIGAINKTLDSSFSYSSLDAVEKQFADLLASSPSMATANEPLNKLISTVRNETVMALNILGALESWVTVQVPKIEDGGNFGVAVQGDVLKVIKGASEDLTKRLDEFPSALEKRAGAWEKVTKKQTKESKESKSSSEDKGGKDGDQNKESKSSSVEEKTTESTAVPDASLHIVALDVKCYVMLHHSLVAARDALLCVGDMVEKNLDKITKPRGTNTQGGSSFMF